LLVNTILPTDVPLLTKVIGNDRVPGPLVLGAVINVNLTTGLGMSETLQVTDSPYTRAREVQAASREIV
jgi:hypothetical protein